LLEQDEDIGLATVYRVLNQFDDAGILIRHHFEGGKSVFEISHKEHHDHLVCLRCGKVVEFEDPVIERRQLEVAEHNNMKLTHHSLYMYGECNDENCDADS
jgi:Fur family ferric uptake transcriptional regulator